MRATVDALKARKQAVGADFLLNLAGFAPSTLHAMVARASLRQIAFNLIVTNVPGPQFPLYCQGAKLAEVFPIAFLYDGQQLAIAIFSYNGMLNFGYLVDDHGVPGRRRARGVCGGGPARASSRRPRPSRKPSAPPAAPPGARRAASRSVRRRSSPKKPTGARKPRASPTRHRGAA